MSEVSVLRRIGLPLLAGALFTAFGISSSALAPAGAMTGQQSAPWLATVLEASVASKLRQLDTLKRDIEQAGCAFAADDASIEGCHQLEAKAAMLEAEIEELKARVGWNVDKQKAVEAGGPLAAPPQPKPYTYRWRTDPRTAYRTVCVRLCDGFYYPISEASRPGSFLAEEKTCQSTCGVPAKLFYQPRPLSDDAGEMVALTGERYADLPNAFRYRSEYLSACACGPKPWSAEAKALYDRRAILATRSKAERIVGAGTAEMAKLLADADVSVVVEGNPAGRAVVVRSKAQYYRGFFGRLRPVRFSAQARNDHPQRRFFLFRGR
ncbi:MAG TPA: DUF2865 domain-containing protein [Methyloceanibacter sp.]|nr:DUF2865 domain-containing protein [Methyloceanibacter sp.]